MKISNVVESIFNENGPTTMLSFMTSMEDRVKIYNDGKTMVQYHDGVVIQYRHCIFMHPTYEARLKQLDAMMKHFGGIDKVSVVFENNTMSFIENANGKRIAGQRNGKLEPWEFKYSNKWSNGSLVFVYTTRASELSSYDTLGTIAKVISN
jgi:hypothetical protein